LRGIASLSLILLASSCAAFMPALRDPAEEALKKEHATCPAIARYPDGLFDGRRVRGVEPLYSTQRSGRSGYETHLIGARLLIERPDGMTPEDIEALLNCHNARSELKRSDEPRIAGDPFWIAERFIEIRVRTEQGLSTVEIEGNNFETSKEIFQRAQDFSARNEQIPRGSAPYAPSGGRRE
jgi:hypothetical protein